MFFCVHFWYRFTHISRRATYSFTNEPVCIENIVVLNEISRHLLIWKFRLYYFANLYDRFWIFFQLFSFEFYVEIQIMVWPFSFNTTHTLVNTIHTEFFFQYFYNFWHNFLVFILNISMKMNCLPSIFDSTKSISFD